MKFCFTLLTAVTVALIACGSNKIGDTCTKVGEQGDCPDNAACVARANQDAVCMLKCEKQTDCPSNTNCNGDPGSQKFCRSNF
jgi:hypothetical protein